MKLWKNYKKVVLEKDKRIEELSSHFLCKMEQSILQEEMKKLEIELKKSNELIYKLTLYGQGSPPWGDDLSVSTWINSHLSKLIY